MNFLEKCVQQDALLMNVATNAAINAAKKNVVDQPNVNAHLANSLIFVEMPS